MVPWTPALLSHVWWRNYVGCHLGLEPDMERGSCGWCPLQNPWKVTGSWVSGARASNPPGVEKRMGYDCLRPWGQISHLRDSQRLRWTCRRALPLTTHHMESQERCWCCSEGHVLSAAGVLFCLTQRRTHIEGPCSEYQWPVRRLTHGKLLRAACTHTLGKRFESADSGVHDGHQC